MARCTEDAKPKTRPEIAWEMAYEHADYEVSVLYHPSDPRRTDKSVRDKLAFQRYRELMYR